MSPNAQADRDAWSDFWAQNSGRGGGGCLPLRSEAMDAAQKSAWLKFIKPLPRSARLLDLATGDGRVLRWMIGARRDLKLTGIDLAPTLPAAPRGTNVRAGVAMEELPFPDERFHAVTSQFGFEYGDVDRVATEIARVLAPNGKVGLMVHRGDGPILRQARARREQIRWVLDKTGLIAKAKTALTMGPGVGAVLPLAAQAVAEGERRYGRGSAGWEIPEAVRRTLALGGRDKPAGVIALLAQIEMRARNEIGGIDSLERACAVADDRDKLENAFRGAGLDLVGREAILEPSGRPFADFLTLRKNLARTP